MDDDLGVRAGREAVAGGDQIVAQGLEVVDLAVDDEGDPLVLGKQRLLPAGHVDDRQAPMAAANRGVEVEPLAVRSARRQGAGHQAESGFEGVGVPATGTGEDAGDSAHGASISSATRYVGLACDS